VENIKKPKVSVVIITYNQEPYIRHCLDGVLMQKTSFPIEILINDDASTDNTALIVKEYVLKNPEIIKPVYQTTNQYSQGVHPWFDILFPKTQGKYVALCEGDDYWIDPLKLQKQVDLMEQNPEISLCFHAHNCLFSNGEYKQSKPKQLKEHYKAKDIILGGGGFMATNSMVFHRKYILDRPEWIDKAPVGDLPLMLLLSIKGKIGYIDNVMSVYRVMSENSWSHKMQNNRLKRTKHHYEILKMWDDFDNFTNKKYHSFIVQKKMKNRWTHLKEKIKNILN